MLCICKLTWTRSFIHFLDILPHSTFLLIYSLNFSLIKIHKLLNMRSTSSSVQFFANLSDFFFPTFVIIFSSFLHFLFIHFILNRFRPSKFSLSFRHLVKKPNLILCSKNVCFSNQVFFFSLRFFSVAKEKFHDEESWRKMDRYRYQFIQSSFFLPLSLIIPLYFTVAV